MQKLTQKLKIVASVIGLCIAPALAYAGGCSGASCPAGGVGPITCPDNMCCDCKCGSDGVGSCVPCYKCFEY